MYQSNLCAFKIIFQASVQEGVKQERKKCAILACRLILGKNNNLILTTARPGSKQDTQKYLTIIRRRRSDYR